MEPDSPVTEAARAKIRIRIKGVDFRMTDQTAADIYAGVVGTGARIVGPLPLPSQLAEARTALREEIRHHFRLLEIVCPNQSTVDALRRHNVPAGVEIAIVAPEAPAPAPDPAAPPAKRNRRHDSRVCAMQFLVSWEVQRQPDMVTALFDYFGGRPQPREYYAFGEELIQGVIRDLPLIDEVIGQYAKNWAFGRIARIDLAILRVAVFELMRRTDIPPVVSINEAVDMAKEFSTEESKRFVNGILDSYKEQLGRDPRKAEGG